MSDTQWPRFQVFLQEKDGLPHMDVGSIHAPDKEMALLNARDVFVRRPECFSLWVVPASAIYSRTSEEIEQDGLEPGGTSGKDVEGAYYIFCKLRHAGTQVYQSTLQASSPQAALARAIESYQGKDKPLVWWVIPAQRVIQTEPGEVASWFDPAREKTFRMSTDFRTVTAMRQIKHHPGE